MLGIDSLLSGCQCIRHLLTLEISFPKLVHKFNSSRIARVWINPAGGCSNGLSADLGIDGSMDQVKIVLCQCDNWIPKLAPAAAAPEPAHSEDLRAPKQAV
jgi:hypothetical protein